MEHISRDEAFTLLKKYNKDPFHIQHALTVEAVMKWYANELGYSEDAEYWGIVGLLHDIDFELYPEEHCIKAPELLREGGVSEDIIHGVVSHGYGITVDIAPEHEMEKDKLFATLDPTTRALQLPNGEKVLMTDTVGFIRKLPHNLIEAFRSTLEEAKYADIIIHVVDCSNDDYERHMSTVYDTLNQLEVKDKPVITLFNKCDEFEEIPILKDSKADYVENISARTGMGIDSFLMDVQDIILKSRIQIERVFPYSDAGKIQLIREYGQLESEEYTQDGIKVKGYVPAWVGGKL